jgi:hypothetical protein
MLGFLAGVVLGICIMGWAAVAFADRQYWARIRLARRWHKDRMKIDHAREYRHMAWCEENRQRVLGLKK